MRRLIDADELLKELESNKLQPTKDTDGFIDGWCEGFNTVVDMIRNQPTAFDMEKVVEQIHDKYCHKCRNILGKQSSEEYCKSVKCEIDALCDIVKKGGVE